MSKLRKEIHLRINASPLLDGEIPDPDKQGLAIEAWSNGQGGSQNIELMAPELHANMQIVEGAVHELDRELEMLVEDVIATAPGKIERSIATLETVVGSMPNRQAMLDDARQKLVDWNTHTPEISTDWIPDDFDGQACCVKVTSVSPSALRLIATSVNYAINSSPELKARIKDFKLRPTPNELWEMAKQ